MKKVTIIYILALFITGINAQNTDFVSYIKQFGASKLPIVISDENSSWQLFRQIYDNELGHNTNKLIPEKYIDKYVSASRPCNQGCVGFRYDYGVILDLSSNFYTVLISKLQYEGKSEWDFDLREILLITYSKSGKILSRKSITKDNDRWQSSFTISKEKIVVQQIKITEPEISLTKELKCEVWTTEYIVLPDGNIKITKTSPIENKKVFWNIKSEILEFID